MKPNGEYLNILKKRGRESRAYKKYQLFGLEISEILGDTRHKALYIKLAKDKGVHFMINPDAHHPEGLADTRFGVGIARKGWLEKEDILNTLPLSKLIPLLEKKRSSLS